ncbi:MULTISPECIES: hypothetical protein [unclassified Rubrivivax]|uniref:hypothetical protein n=1 Tax=unclassified Rubrivivax TaxID=2649762 RepID=UPI001E54F066|nr:MULTISPECIES: hypothetical protein [unclassified Rubrivivax]MCC9596983.1 hypothetical protein [Rubrivivax sp. JA1055]MCC9649138.1 hypothetical protein [Rubrivivax sp. JA1029]
MNTLTEALADIDLAFRHLEFAVRMMLYCEQGHLNLKEFDSDITLLLPRENIGFRPGSFSSQEAIILPARAMVGIAFGVSAMVLEAAFCAASKKRKPTSRDPADELHALIYMIRCAFAHNPALPVWEARGNDYARNIHLTIDSEVLCVDLKTLNGRPFEYEHIGGLANWHKIREAAESLLS